MGKVAEVEGDSHSKLARDIYSFPMAEVGEHFQQLPLIQVCPLLI